ILADLEALPINISYVEGRKNPADALSRLTDHTPSILTVDEEPDAGYTIEKVTDPKKQVEIATYVHQLGHRGEAATLHTIQKLWKWPVMRTTVRRVINDCTSCRIARAKPACDFHPARRLVPIPFWRVHLDFAKLAPDQYLLVAACAYSGWPEAALTPSKQSKGVIDFFRRTLLARHGSPVCVVTDNGPEFASHDFKTLLESLQVIYVPIVPDAHESNGVAEKAIHMIKGGMQKAILAGQRMTDLPNILENVLQDIRFTPRTRTASPFQAVYGRAPRDPRLVEILQATQHSSLQPGDEVIKTNPNSIASALEERPAVWTVRAAHRGSVTITRGKDVEIVSSRLLKKLPRRPPIKIGILQRPTDGAEDATHLWEGDEGKPHESTPQESLDVWL
ncbi:MAG: hypothetical protein KVP17_003961, partial [Porospora cf. gigantea B]